MIDETTPLYSSRVLKTYIEYLKCHYPGGTSDSVLRECGISDQEVSDPGFWLSQAQVDQFHDAIKRATGDEEIAYKAGLYYAEAPGLGAARRFALGMITPMGGYTLMAKIYKVISRAVDLSTHKLGPRKVALSAVPLPGVEEKPYQCANRIGGFKSVPRLFGLDYATVEHPKCWHRGDRSCDYIVSWKPSTPAKWLRMRNWLALITLLWLPLGFFLPSSSWLVGAMSAIVGVLLLSVIGYRLTVADLEDTIETQGEIAQENVEEMNARHNHARLMHEVGQLGADSHSLPELLRAVGDRFAQRLHKRGNLALLHQGGIVDWVDFGHSDADHRRLQAAFENQSESNLLPILRPIANSQPCYLLGNKKEMAAALPKDVFEAYASMEVHSLLVIPIIYEKSPYGLLFIDDQGQRDFDQSDVSFLLGVVSQIAAAIAHLRAIEQLQESEAKYRQLVENANSIILRLQIDGTVTFANEYALSFFGFTNDDQIVGKNAADTVFPGDQLIDIDSTDLSPEDSGVFPALQAMPFDSQQHTISEHEHIRHDGQRAWVTWTHRPIVDSQGDTKEILSIGNDITKIRRAEKEHKKLEAQVIQMQKMESIGTLAGGIAHDFNNLLMGVQGHTSLLLLDKDPNDPELENIKGIEEAVNRAKELTKQLLGFARGGKYEVRPVKINGVVDAAVTMFGRTKKELRIHTEYADDLWTVELDTHQFDQVLLNLFVNAWQAMPTGGDLSVETQNVVIGEQDTKPGLAAGRYVMTSVTDTGTGMDEATQQRIFEPFFTTKAMGRGTGLGLASVYGIVKNHGGFIDVTSQPDSGSTFSVLLPASDAECTEVTPTKSPVKRGRERVLLVDDEALILSLGKKLLERLGYEVHCAAGGAAALALVAEEHFDLVILDMIMPEMSGAETFDRLRSKNPSVKVLLSSGYSLGKEATKLLSICDGFLPKPYDLEQLSAKIRECLDH